MTTPDPASEATTLSVALRQADPLNVIRAAVAATPKLAAVSSFGTESAVLLKLVTDVDRHIPVLFLDTGWLFPETLAYRDELIARLGLSDVRSLRPDGAALRQRDGDDDLWQRDPDACCALRKVEPLAQALEGFDGWINGRKRFQSSDRATIDFVEADAGKLKFNPLANTTRQQIEIWFAEWDLPRHPLEQHGFRSIGCMPCTSRTTADEDPRAGRWRGRGKSECGIHAAAPVRG
jgi:phosphoadenosine phosphosulfate reductase